MRKPKRTDRWWFKNRIMNSIQQECTQFKQKYDTCHNMWFSEHFLKGDTDDSICAPLFKLYQDCLKKAMKERNIQIKEIEAPTFEVEMSKSSPDSSKKTQSGIKSTEQPVNKCMCWRALLFDNATQHTSLNVRFVLIYNCLRNDNKVDPDVFRSLLNLDVKTLVQFPAGKIRAMLPCLVRMSLIAPSDSTSKCASNRKDVLTMLASIEVVNNIVALLSIDFHGLEVEVKQEQNLRKKIGNVPGDSILNQQIDTGLALQFERVDSTRRLRLVLCELLYIASQISEHQKNANEFYLKDSDLFDNAVYIPEVCDVINIALAELPALLNIQEIAQTLLHVKHGSQIICWIVANFPDCFYDVCISLIQSWDKIEDENGGSRIRMEALTELCKMYPQGAYFVRSKCVELCKMPALTITLTLDFPRQFQQKSGSCYVKTGGDIIAFVSGLLLGNDQAVRNWFSVFVRFKPKKIKETNAALQRLRDELIIQLENVVKATQNQGSIPYSCVVHGSVLLRLYCALRGIAGIKFQDDEILLLIRLMTINPPATPEGVRFASIAVCMLFACPSLISQPEYENKCIQWLKYLSGSDSPFFGKPTDITASFSEMLLLLAIQIHGTQVGAITDVVCSTLGMKVTIRSNNMSRIKTIFIQEVFTEQVVTSRAISVLVTPNLNSNIHGFLPIHCIHQLMKSRAFSKYKVNVKDWIYKQICASVEPLHPLLPSLIEAYVNSMLNIANKISQDSTINEPISESEILKVFKESQLYTCEPSEFGNKSCMPQLLLLYYILLYEDVRLSNIHTYISLSKVVKSYSSEFLSAFPIKYLLQRAQKDQHHYSGLFSSLLRLLATHFPHLSLVEDWLEDDDYSAMVASSKMISETSLAQGLQSMSSCPSEASRLLNELNTMPLTQMWPYVKIFIKYLRNVMNDNVPLYVQELYKKIWFRYNSILPRALWIMTVEALLHEKAGLPTITQTMIVTDPALTLRLDERVKRCPAVLSIVIRVLQSTLAASRSLLSRYSLDGPLTNMIHNQMVMNDALREEMRNTLVIAQESLAAQILLEFCMQNDTDRSSKAKLWSLREIQSLICSHLHQSFIAEPNLCRLVHFQGYPRSVLHVAVAGIPSMHICVDYIVEMISRPTLSEKVFAIDLISHLSLQYSLPQSMRCARLALNTLSTLLSADEHKSRNLLMARCLPSLTRFCVAFPVLAEDVVALLTQIGRVCVSEASLRIGCAEARLLNDDNIDATVFCDYLLEQVEHTFDEVIANALLQRKIY